MNTPKNPFDGPPFPPGFSDEPWSDWKPLWNSSKSSPHDFQEQHSPTRKVSLRLTAERKIQTSRRRLSDVRLWNAMSPSQQDAAAEIAVIFEIIGMGMGYVMNNWQRIPGCKGRYHVPEAHARMSKLYMVWATTCLPSGINHAMVVDVLCFGYSCRMVDRNRRQKNGTARANLLRGLSLYCELRGWPV